VSQVAQNTPQTSNPAPSHPQPTPGRRPGQPAGRPSQQVAAPRDTPKTVIQVPVQTTPPQQQQQTAAKPEPTPATTPAAPPPPPPIAPADIQSVIAAYEGALEAKSLDRMRGVYPALPPDQTSNWTTFFQFASKIKSEFRVSNIQPATGDVATATVQGQLHFEVQGKSQDQPHNYVATLTRHDGKWRIESIK